MYIKSELTNGNFTGKKEKKPFMLNNLLSSRYYISLPDDDLISKQRYKLFRAFSLASFVVCCLFTVQTVSLSNISNGLVYLITAIGILLAANFYLLPVHRKSKSAYLIAAILSPTSSSIQPVRLPIARSGALRS